jgi:hypothetical protein
VKDVAVESKGFLSILRRWWRFAGDGSWIETPKNLRIDSNTSLTALRFLLINFPLHERISSTAVNHESISHHRQERQASEHAPELLETRVNFYELSILSFLSFEDFSDSSTANSLARVEEAIKTVGEINFESYRRWTRLTMSRCCEDAKWRKNLQRHRKHIRMHSSSVLQLENWKSIRFIDLTWVQRQRHVWGGREDS